MSEEGGRAAAAPNPNNDNENDNTTNNNNNNNNDDNNNENATATGILTFYTNPPRQIGCSNPFCKRCMLPWVFELSRWVDLSQIVDRDYERRVLGWIYSLSRGIPIKYSKWGGRHFGIGRIIKLSDDLEYVSADAQHHIKETAKDQTNGSKYQTGFNKLLDFKRLLLMNLLKTNRTHLDLDQLGTTWWLDPGQTTTTRVPEDGNPTDPLCGRIHHLDDPNNDVTGGNNEEEDSGGDDDDDDDGGGGGDNAANQRGRGIRRRGRLRGDRDDDDDRVDDGGDNQNDNNNQGRLGNQSARPRRSGRRRGGNDGDDDRVDDCGDDDNDNQVRRGNRRRRTKRSRRS